MNARRNIKAGLACLLGLGLFGCDNRQDSKVVEIPIQDMKMVVTHSVRPANVDRVTYELFDANGSSRFKIRVNYGEEKYIGDGYFKSKIIGNDSTIFGNKHGAYGFFADTPKQ